MLEMSDEANAIVGDGLLDDLIPGFQYVWETQKMRQLKAITKELFDCLSTKLKEHKDSFDKGTKMFLF